MFAIAHRHYDDSRLSAAAARNPERLLERPGFFLCNDLHESLRNAEKHEFNREFSTFSAKFAAFASRIKEQFCFLSVAVASAIVFLVIPFSLAIQLRSALVKRTSSSATCSIRRVIFLSVMRSPSKVSDVAKANRGIMMQRKSSMRLLAYAMTDM